MTRAYALEEHVSRHQTRHARRNALQHVYRAAA